MTISRALSCLFLAAAIPIFAHHSFTMFDMTKKITLVGTVTTFEWTNPHSYIEIDVPDEQGVVKHHAKALLRQANDDDVAPSVHRDT